ncbi:hypothetical protein [uncultured virus]|uniref:Uncharacterized protein n=1 Tax=uncultured virus TaxID=340016 RepID=A0A218MLX6_9VIRU|nr:hypothetical protein [uncultured virus]
MSAFRGIATGFLQAKIRNTEANDALKANTLMRVGETLIGETIPNAIAAEKERKSNYDMLSKRYSPEFAEVADVAEYTLNQASMKKLEEDLKANNLDEEALKNANFETNFNNRYNTRVKSAEEKYNPILKQLGVDNIGALGYNTVEALVKPTTTTTKDTMADTVTQTPIEFDSMQLGDYLDKIPEPSRVETKFEKLKINVLDRNKPYGNYNISTSAEGGYIFNIADEYNTMYDIHLDINDSVESSKLGSNRTQSEIASISTQLIQNNIIKPAQALTLAKSNDGFATTGLNTYIDINTITENKNKKTDINFNVNLEDVELTNNQKFAIYKIIKQVDESRLTDYGINRNLYNAIKQSKDAGAFSQTNPEGFKDAYTSAVLVTADQIDKSYGDKASQFFLASLANVKNKTGGNINTTVSFRLNQIKANRLNNR